MARRDPTNTGGSLFDRLRQSVTELDAARLQERFAGLALTNAGDCPARQPVRVGGEVRGVRLAAPDDAPVTEVTISDGTGSVTARFSGRRHIAGFQAGRAVVLEGVAGRVGNRLVLRDPAYTLLP